MDDVFGRTAAFVFLIILMFLTPIVVIYNNTDAVIQNRVQQSVEEFVDTSRSTGVISYQNYRTLADSLAQTNNTYTVNILHKAVVSVPYSYKDSDGNIVNSYRSSYQTYNLDDIMLHMGMVEGSGIEPYRYMCNSCSYVSHSNFAQCPSCGHSGTAQSALIYQDYVMKDGDYITVSVESQQDSFGSHLFATIVGHGSGLKTSASAGGMIGNTKR